MRKWRPTYKCLYVIPEVYGNAELLQIMLNRILPLRFSIYQEDMLVMLGDYVDKGLNSCGVLDILISVRKEYGEAFHCLLGNQDAIFLEALKSENNYREWLLRGGAIVIQSYLSKINMTTTPQSISFSRVFDIIPSSHIDFLKSLPSHLEIDNYLFFHGGVDLKSPFSTGDATFIHDTGSSKKFKLSLRKKEELIINSDRIFIGAHNYGSKSPFVNSKYLMLGGSAPQKLTLFELNSMTCAMLKQGKGNIYKHNFKYFE